MGRTITCYGQIPCRNVIQEWYETASFDAARRTRQLKAAGISCKATAMGTQVTSVGYVKMTCMNIFGWADAAAHDEPLTVADLPTADWRLEQC